MRQEQPILTPSQVGQYIKGFMDRDRVLSGLLVRGELSNYKMYPSGHHYFTLKDGEGALRCVMFRGDAASLRFRPQNGMQVIAAGRVTVFPRAGQYQLYCVRLTPEGAGDLYPVSYTHLDVYKRQAEYSTQVARDESGLFAEDREELFARGVPIYEELTREFPCLELKASCLLYTSSQVPSTATRWSEPAPWHRSVRERVTSIGPS